MTVLEQIRLCHPMLDSEQLAHIKAQFAAGAGAVSVHEHANGRTATIQTHFDGMVAASRFMREMERKHPEMPCHVLYGPDG